MSRDVFESLQIILETAELKHESILSNIRSLEIKTSIILAFFGVLLLPAFEIFQWDVIYGWQFIIKLLPALTVLIGILFCLFALFPQSTISHPKLATLRIMFAAGINPNELRAELFSLYQMASEHNARVSMKKLSLTKMSFIFLLISLSVIMLSFIFKGVIDA